MKCPYCEQPDTKVLDSRPVGDGGAIRRRRECLSCEARFTTYERYEESKIRVIKKDGKREFFDRNKILDGLLKACEKRKVTNEDIENVVQNIEDKIRKSGKNEIPTSDIGDQIMKHLKTLDQVSYVRFASVYKEFRDLDHFLDEIKNLKKLES